MAYYYNSDDSDIEEIDIPTVVLPYQFEPLASATLKYPSDSDDDSSSSAESQDVDETDGSISDISKWCHCGKCQVMPTRRECVCCHSVSAVDDKRQQKCVDCITESSGFNAICLDLDALETAYYEFREINGPPNENHLIHETYRYIAYRQFTRWIWKILGRKNRKVLPSCVVTNIREQFRSEEYCGFKYAI